MNKSKVKIIIDKLSKVYLDKPELIYSTPYELLVAVILSAQCTDKRVNKVTAELFKEYNTPQKMITLSAQELEKKIFSCGLYKTKAEHLLSASRDILEKFNGKVPSTLKELQALSGVGRKTANVVYSVAFNGQAIAVDTHVFRVSNRIGLANANNVLATENALMQAIDKESWAKAHHYLIYLGRNCCTARKPDCANCVISAECEKHL